MLKLFGSRENIDKERFVYEHIDKDAIVIVPDQYTLIAEEQALRFTGKACLFDIEILGMNRIGMRILREKGLENLEVLDKYGRYMYLSKIIREHHEDFNIFKKAVRKPAFISMVNDFISDCKKQNIDCSAIEALTGSDEINELLKLKLIELGRIFQEYENKIDGKYFDSEDYVSKYVELTKEAEFIKNNSFWVYGFDSMTPMFISALMEITKYSRGVNIIVNESSFGLGRIVRRMLEGAAVAGGIAHEYQMIGEDYLIDKSDEIKTLERYLFADERPIKKSEVSNEGDSSDKNTTDNNHDVTLVEAANPYNEAENAAIYITKLIRDENYKLGDIVIIANEEKKMQSVVKRVFSEYNLNLFADSRRNITDTQVVLFIISQLKCISSKLRSSDLMTMLKSGVTYFLKDEIECLDSYVKNYGIKGNMWRKPFKYYQDDRSDALTAINATRAKVHAKLEVLEQIVKQSEKVKDFVDEYIDYLEREWNLTQLVEFKIRELTKANQNAAAQVMSGSYSAVFHVLDQILTIAGEDEFSLKEFIELFEAGVVNVDIATIPPAKDAISMGTLIRTRPGDVKAVVILGANEGILPLSPSTEGLFSIDEKSYFKEREFTIGRLDDLKQLEENSALYRVISKPKEKLYISYALADAEGNARKASSFVADIKNILNIEIDKDLVSQGFSSDLLQSRYEALRHSINYINSRKKTYPDDESAVKIAEERDVLASSVISWFEKREPDSAESIKQAAEYDNKMKNIEPVLAKELYKNSRGDISLSATRMERFQHCPFKHFVEKGLRPEEDREFKTDVRDIGEMYHSCIMQVSKNIMDNRADFKELHGRGEAGTSEFDARLEKLVSDTLDEESGKHRGGIFESDENEKFRLSRLEKICKLAVKAVAEQLLDDELSESFFEESFRKDGRAAFSPIEIQIDDETVFVEGKIDRVDFMGDTGVRVVDYKTGNDEVNKEHLRNGYKMQLMVYLEGACDNAHKPAGVFYFNIKDELPNITKEKAEKAKDKIEENKKRFELRGLYVTENNDPESRHSGAGKAKSIGITSEEFEDIRKDVRNTMKDIASGIINGDIRINPVYQGTKTNAKIECTYCQYRSICRFDLSYDGNEYRYIK